MSGFDILKLLSEARVDEILAENSDKDFVRRIQEPEKSPSILNKDGSESSHRMAYEVGEALGEEKGKWYVFPTIQRDKRGNLKDYKDWKRAWGPAKKNNDYIKFDTREDAEWFEKNWKVKWGMEPRQ